MLEVLEVGLVGRPVALDHRGCQDCCRRKAGRIQGNVYVIAACLAAKNVPRKNSRHRIHFDPLFHKLTRSFSPAPVLFMSDSCSPEAEIFNAWPESDTLKTLSKSSRLRTEPFKRLLPVTPDTVNNGCFASNRLSVADCEYAVFVSNS